MDNEIRRENDIILGNGADPIESEEAAPPVFERRKARGRTLGGTLDPQTAEKLKSFFRKNAEAVNAEVASFQDSAANSATGAAAQAAAEVEAVANKYDVFSPDVRSTRWQEFLDLMSSGDAVEQFDKFKKAAAGVRGNNKAFTLAVTRPNQDGNDNGFSSLH